MCFKLNKCCCCASTETGTKVIAILGIVGAILGLLSNIATLQWSAIVGSLVEVGVCACLLYGTLKRKPAFIMVWMVLAMITIVLICLAFVALCVFTALADDQMIQEFLKEMQIDDQFNPEMIQTGLIASIVICLIVIVLDIYFWAVVYSFYKEVNERNTDPSGYMEAGAAEMTYKS